MGDLCSTPKDAAPLLHNSSSPATSAQKAAAVQVQLHSNADLACTALQLVVAVGRDLGAADDAAIGLSQHILGGTLTELANQNNNQRRNSSTSLMLEADAVRRPEPPTIRAATLVEVKPRGLMNMLAVTDAENRCSRWRAINLLLPEEKGREEKE